MSKDWLIDSKYGSYRKTGEDNDIAQFKSDLEIVYSERGGSRKSVHDGIFELGMKTALEQINKEGTHLQPGTIEHARLITRLEEIKALEREHLFRAWDNIRRSKGSDGFRTWATENQFPEEQVADFFDNWLLNSPKPQMTQAEADREFLAKVFEVEEVLSIDRVKEYALAAGVVRQAQNGTLEGWERLEYTAKAVGYPKNHPTKGMWAKAPVDR